MFFCSWIIWRGCFFMPVLSCCEESVASSCILSVCSVLEECHL